VWPVRERGNNGEGGRGGGVLLPSRGVRGLAFEFRRQIFLGLALAQVKFFGV